MSTTIPDAEMSKSRANTISRKFIVTSASVCASAQTSGHHPLNTHTPRRISPMPMASVAGAAYRTPRTRPTMS